jgi:hypothetical protein
MGNSIIASLTSVVQCPWWMRYDMQQMEFDEKVVAMSHNVALCSGVTSACSHERGLYLQVSDWENSLV